MKTVIMAIAILLAGTTTFAQEKNKMAHPHQHMTKTKYTCTMHPEVVRNKPGKCPKCGMALVKMKKGKTAKMEGMKM